MNCLLNWGKTNFILEVQKGKKEDRGLLVTWKLNVGQKNAVWLLRKSDRDPIDDNRANKVITPGGGAPSGSLAPLPVPTWDAHWKMLVPRPCFRGAVGYLNVCSVHLRGGFKREKWGLS